MQIGFTYLPLNFFLAARSLSPKWKSLVITTEILDINVSSMAFCKFLVYNCPQLDYLQVKISESFLNKQLDDLLKELVQVSEMKLFCYGSTSGLGAILSKHTERLLNPNFKLSINFVHVQPNLKNLEPIYKLDENERYNEVEMEQVNSDARLNFNRREFYDGVHKILLDEDQCRELVEFERHSKRLKRMDQLNVWKDRMDVDLDRFLRTVPDSILVMTLRTLDPLPQYTLDAIPKLLPNLSLFILNNLGSSIPDLRFLGRLNYLSELKLKDITFSFASRDALCEVIEDGRFLASLTVEYLEKSSGTFGQNIRPQLLAAFKRKMRTNKSIKFETFF